MDAWTVWASLRERFGDPRRAPLARALREAIVRERRGLRIDRWSDGFGSGTVTVAWLSVDPPVDDGGGIDVEFARPAVITDAEMRALTGNGWESWNDLPGVPL